MRTLESLAAAAAAAVDQYNLANSKQTIGAPNCTFAHLEIIFFFFQFPEQFLLVRKVEMENKLTTGA